jgi:hypothetical protein
VDVWVVGRGGLKSTPSPGNSIFRGENLSGLCVSRGRGLGRGGVLFPGPKRSPVKDGHMQIANGKWISIVKPPESVLTKKKWDEHYKILNIFSSFYFLKFFKLFIGYYNKFFQLFWNSEEGYH